MGFWSTDTSRATPARSSVISPMSVDFPDPDTPVTAVSTPNGNSAVTPRRLCRLTGPIFNWPRAARTWRTGVGERSKRKRAVADRSTEASSGTGPLCSTSPPCSPASGPTSTSQSAPRMTSRWCSTTNTEFPADFSRSRTVSRASVSAGCRPADGSSST